MSGAGRRDDALGGFESVEEMARHGARLVAIAAVESGLPAAGLALREIDLVAEAFENIAISMPTLGKSWSTMQVTNNETRYPCGNSAPTWIESFRGPESASPTDFLCGRCMISGAATSVRSEFDGNGLHLGVLLQSYSPSSRPIPDCLNPPKGARWSRTL